MVFHWRQRDSKSPQVSRTLLSNLTDLKNAVVWMVKIFPPISTLPLPFLNLRAPIQVRRLQLVLPSLSRYTAYLELWKSRNICRVFFFFFFFFAFYIFTLWSPTMVNSTIQQFPPTHTFLLIITRSDLLACNRWSVCISKSREFHVSYAIWQILVCAYTIFQ